MKNPMALSPQVKANCVSQAGHNTLPGVGVTKAIFFAHLFCHFLSYKNTGCLLSMIYYLAGVDIAYRQTSTISRIKSQCFSSRLAVVFAQSIEVNSRMKM